MTLQYVRFQDAIALSRFNHPSRAQLAALIRRHRGPWTEQEPPGLPADFGLTLTVIEGHLHISATMRSAGPAGPLPA